MPAYYILNNLGLKHGDVIERGTISSLSMLSQSTIEIHIEKGTVKLLKTPPIASHPKLKKHATKLAKLGIETLGDFATHDLAELKAKKITSVENLQSEILAMIDPTSALGLDDICCE